MESIEIGKRIAEYRKHKKLTQAQLADLLMVSNRTISKWENGISQPDIGTMTKICNIFDISMDEFLDKTIIPKPIKRKNSYLKIFITSIKYIWNNIVKILFIIAFVFLSIYFLANFDTFKLYKIKCNIDDVNKNIYIDNGLFIESKDKNILIINNIKLVDIKDYEPVSTVVTIYTYVNGDKYYLYESSELKSIYIEEQYGYDEIFSNDVLSSIKKNLYLNINIIDSNGQNHNYEANLKLIKEASNNKLAYVKLKKSKDKNDIDLSNLEIDEVKLLNNGFKKDIEYDYYTKEVNNKTYIINLKNNLLTIHQENGNKKKTYLFDFKKNRLVTKVYDQESNIIEAYQYYDNKNLICEKGKCSDYLKDYEFVSDEFLDLIY